ncbi:MAG: 50S ribosomal protein L6 [Methanobacteriota archaeon]
MSRITQEKIEVPNGVDLKVSGNNVEVSGKKGKLSRNFDLPKMRIKADGRAVSAEIESVRRKDRAAVGTFKAHMLNMIKGVSEGFVYKLQVVYSHFPITVKVEGERVTIHNFIGERSARASDIVGDVTVEVSGDEIFVKGINKEDVGQTAYNIEQATSVRYRDRKTFQDGCYIVEQS